MHYSNYETRLTTAAFPFEAWESKLHIFYSPPLFQLYSQCFIFKGNCNPGLLLTSWLCSFTIKSGDGVPVIFMISLSWSRSNSEIWLRISTDFWYSIVSFLFSLQVQWDQHEETVKTGKCGISLNFAVKWRIQVVTLKHRLHIKDGEGLHARLTRWRIRSLPLNSGFPSSISAIMQPADQISTATQSKASLSAILD